MRAIFKFSGWDLPQCNVQDHLTVYGSNGERPRVIHVVGKFFWGQRKRRTLLSSEKQKINADLYVKVLEEHMLNFFRIHGSEVFMRDSAPCHKAKKVTRFLEQQQINVLEWKGNSLDLNPIESCLQKMKKLCQNRNP